MDVTTDRARRVGAMMDGDQRPAGGAVLDPQAAAARRQNALDRIAELLEGWGSVDAQNRARHVLDAVLDQGYTLPDALAPAPPRGSGSTEQGRARARALFEAELAARRTVVAQASR